MLLQHDADVDSKDNYGYTPLSRATEHGHADVVEMLLKRNAAIGVKNNDSGRKLLLWALKNGLGNIVKILLNRSADVDSKNKSGCTALSRAPQNRHATSVELPA
jgi:ankyrin repeat protein